MWNCVFYCLWRGYLRTIIVNIWEVLHSKKTLCNVSKNCYTQNTCFHISWRCDDKASMLSIINLWNNIKKYTVFFEHKNVSPRSKSKSLTWLEITCFTKFNLDIFRWTYNILISYKRKYINNEDTDADINKGSGHSHYFYWGTPKTMIMK